MTPPILTRIAEGDKAAVTDCLDRYGALVWSVARRFLADRAEAEDAVQEVFIDLWNHAARFDPNVAEEKTFVVMIARRRVIDRVRQNRRRPATEEIDSQVADDPRAFAITLEQPGGVVVSDGPLLVVATVES